MVLINKHAMEELQQQLKQQRFATDNPEIVLAREENGFIEPAQGACLNKEKLIFIAMLFFKLFGIINYICDVGSDLVNGYWYLDGQEWPRLSDNSDYNYTRALCDDWKAYKHPNLGALTISLVWIPSAFITLFLGRNFHLVPL